MALQKELVTFTLSDSSLEIEVRLSRDELLEWKSCEPVERDAKVLSYYNKLRKKNNGKKYDY